MHRYKRLIITAAVIVVLLVLLSLVQAQINNGFRAYLTKRYPERKFSLSAPSIQLFPLRFEVNVYAPEDKVNFTCKAVFSFSKLASTTHSDNGVQTQAAVISPAPLLQIKWLQARVLAAAPVDGATNDAAANDGTTTKEPQADAAATLGADAVAPADGDGAAAATQDNKLDMSVVEPERPDDIVVDSDWQKYLPGQKELLQFSYVYSDNYLEQKQAQTVMESVKPLLQTPDFKDYIDRCSVSVSIKDHEQFVNLSDKELTTTQLMLRFNSKLKTQDEVAARIKLIIDAVNGTGIKDLDAIYFESAALARNEEQFAQLGVTAETWVKTSELATAENSAANASDYAEEQVKETVVVASGYSNDLFYYCFNYNLDFMPINEALIKNGLRIRELHRESIERFGRAWNYNLNQ